MLVLHFVVGGFAFNAPLCHRSGKRVTSRIIILGSMNGSLVSVIRLQRRRRAPFAWIQSQHTPGLHFNADGCAPDPAAHAVRLGTHRRQTMLKSAADAIKRWLATPITWQPQGYGAQ
jgi:hypothetical protein